MEKFEKFLKHYQKSNGDKLLPNTIEKYLYYISPYHEELNGLDDKSMIEYMQREMNKRPSQVLFATFRMWMRMTGIDTDDIIYKSLKKPKTRATSKTSFRHLQSKIVSQAEFKKLYEKLTDYERMIFRVLFDTGMRRSEALLVRLKDIQVLKAPKDNIYAVIDITGKGDKNRTVYLTKETLNDIRLIHNDLDSERKLIDFRDSKGNPLTSQENALYRLIHNRTKEILGRPLFPHAMRASLFTHLSNLGADSLHIKSLAGHSSVKTTEIYARQSAYQGRQAFKKMQEELE